MNPAMMRKMGLSLDEGDYFVGPACGVNGLRVQRDGEAVTLKVGEAVPEAHSFGVHRRISMMQRQRLTFVPGVKGKKAQTGKLVGDLQKRCDALERELKAAQESLAAATEATAALEAQVGDHLGTIESLKADAADPGQTENVFETIGIDLLETMIQGLKKAARDQLAAELVEDPPEDISDEWLTTQLLAIEPAAD